MAGTAAARYTQLEPDRQPYLDRGRTCAKLTIPSLLPVDGSNGASQLPTPYQGIGARGVNNLASKLLLTLFPPSTPCFKMAVDEMTLVEITGQEGMQAEVEKALSAYVKRVMTHIESRAIRTSVFEGLKQTIVAGNALLYVPEIGGVRVYRLDKFVCKRDPAGTMLETVVKEPIALMAIPKEIRDQLPTKQDAAPTSGSGKDSVAPPTEQAQKPYDLYTHIYLEDDQYVVYQEIEGIQVAGSTGRYPAASSPWIILRFVKVDGEDYGRSYIEEYLGDLSSLEDLTKAVVQYAAIAARIVPLVNPNGMTSVKRFVQAENGQPIEGKADDITYSQIDKYNDLRVAKELMSEIERRLGFAFLLNTSIQRPGERVTAEEIRFMARELEDALGGVYSVQSQELQKRLLDVLIAQLERISQLPELPNQIVPQIITGMDALGRGHELAALDTWIMPAKEVPQIGATINWGDYMQRRANALGVDTGGLVKTPEQIAQEQQQAQMMAMMEKLGPNAVNQVGGMAQQQMEPEA